MRSASASDIPDAPERCGTLMVATAGARGAEERARCAAARALSAFERAALAAAFDVETRQPCQANIVATNIAKKTKETVVDARDCGEDCPQLTRNEPVCRAFADWRAGDVLKT